MKTGYSLLILTLFLVPSLTGVAQSSVHLSLDPCDVYANCLSSSITYISSNPDGTLFEGDSFAISLNITKGPDTSSASVTWTYDQSVFSASLSSRNATFIAVSGSAGTYVISANVTFYGTSYSTSTLSTGETVEVLTLRLSLSTRIVNLSDVYGNVLRNPDGSFYRNDSFCVTWNSSFQFSNYRKDISVNVTILQSPVLALLNHSSSAPGRKGQSCYLIEDNASYSPYNLALIATAVNSRGSTIGVSNATVPFAVVQYSPHFTYYTYMKYDGSGSSTYQKEFVTLVRYDGNDPGYSYSGNENTDPLVAGNDTGERVFIDNFTFSADGWIASPNVTSPNLSKDLTYNEKHNLSLAIVPQNSTYNVVTWGNRVQKYYFAANMTDMGSLLSQGFTYLNVSEFARSMNFAGGNYSLFNTSYLYQPVFYSGYLVFKAYDSQGNPDPSVNVTVTVHNTRPLDPYLVSEVESVFGNDTTVVDTFRNDLYPAYNETQNLVPLYRGSGTTVFLMNQTNLATEGSQMPYFTVTATGHGNTYSYKFNDSFSTIFLDNGALPPVPPSNFTALFVDSTLDIAALPLNISLDGNASYLVWGVQLPGCPVLPLSGAGTPELCLSIPLRPE